MDRETGKIYRSISDVPEGRRPFSKEMAIPPTNKQQRLGRVGRNDPCPCGSGVKFKKCCKLKTR